MPMMLEEKVGQMVQFAGQQRNAAASWSCDMRETRSATLSVIGNDGFRNGAFAKTDEKSSEDEAVD